MNKVISLILVIMLNCSTVMASYEVKGKAVSSTMYSEGICKTDKSKDEVTYMIDLDNNKITRTSVFNADIKDGPFAGMQPDNTVYHIVYNEVPFITQGESNRGKTLIKAIGQTGAGDGFETIVIGEDFIDTCNSKFDYFMLYHYKRTQ